MVMAACIQNIRYRHRVLGAFRAPSAYEELAPLTFMFVWLHGSRDRSAPVPLGFLSSVRAVYASSCRGSAKFANPDWLSLLWVAPEPTCVLSSPATSVASRISRLSRSLCHLLPRMTRRRRRH